MPLHLRCPSTFGAAEHRTFWLAFVAFAVVVIAVVVAIAFVVAVVVEIAATVEASSVASAAVVVTSSLLFVADTPAVVEASYFDFYC